jgi:hypothetical protein
MRIRKGRRGEEGRAACNGISAEPAEGPAPTVKVLETGVGMDKLTRALP